MATYYPETGTLVDEWCVDDVLEQRPDLNWEQASDVLYTMAHHFDATIGYHAVQLETLTTDWFDRFCVDDAQCPRSDRRDIPTTIGVIEAAAYLTNIYPKRRPQ
jgi:hypothetical protein